jgi:hypothetical protein
MGELLQRKALHPPAASVGSFYFYPSLEQAQLGLETKIPVNHSADRTFDL